MQRFTGIILAGGASRRMGYDKAQMRIGDKPMLDLMTEQLQACGAETVEVLGRAGGMHHIPDRFPLAGPAVALQDYLSSAKPGSRHLVVPVDMPGLHSASLRTLLRQPGWAYYEGHMLPMLAIAEGRKQTPVHRLKDLLRQNEALELPPPSADLGFFMNLNTPEDLAQWRRHAPQPEEFTHV